MSQKQKSVSENIAAVETAGRELLQSALPRNPLAVLAANAVAPLVNLLHGRRRKPAAAVRKVKLESYSYSPVRKERSRRPKSRTAVTSGMQEGGSHHG